MDVAGAQYVAVKGVDLQQTVDDFKARWVAQAKLDVDPSLVTLRLVNSSEAEPKPEEEAIAKEWWSYNLFFRRPVPKHNAAPRLGLRHVRRRRSSSPAVRTSALNSAALAPAAVRAPPATSCAAFGRRCAAVAPFA